MAPLVNQCRRQVEFRYDQSGGAYVLSEGLSRGHHQRYLPDTNTSNQMPKSGSHWPRQCFTDLTNKRTPSPPPARSGRCCRLLCPRSSFSCDATSGKIGVDPLPAVLHTAQRRDGHWIVLRAAFCLTVRVLRRWWWSGVKRKVACRQNFVWLFHPSLSCLAASLVCVSCPCDDEVWFPVRLRHRTE